MTVDQTVSAIIDLLIKKTKDKTIVWTKNVTGYDVTLNDTIFDIQGLSLSDAALLNIGPVYCIFSSKNPAVKELYDLVHESFLLPKLEAILKDTSDLLIRSQPPFYVPCSNNKDSSGEKTCQQSFVLSHKGK